ncbi:hypothetical protein J6590_053781 [Homalodisca vitripennis]|nr:hypothetical protein J6590_053781 [Homalodisca vitripennis]
MIIFRKSDMDTATGHGMDVAYEMRSFTYGPTNPKFSPRKAFVVVNHKHCLSNWLVMLVIFFFRLSLKWLSVVILGFDKMVFG